LDAALNRVLAIGMLLHHFRHLHQRNNPSNFPLPRELMLVGDFLAYIDIFSVFFLLGILSRSRPSCSSSSRSSLESQD
jgi:hypothetical protein